jgi:transcriptional regulator with XRE-family HTH domain
MLKLNLLPKLKKEGISKNQLALLLGIQRKALRPWFKDGHDAKLSTVETLAKHLNCKALDLLEEDSRLRPKKSKLGKRPRIKKK